MKFSEILEEYLEEWDRQHSDYYDNKMIGSSRNGRERMEELAKEMDTMFIRLEANINILKEYADE